MLEQITPLILTYDEAPNIGRVLERLGWAREIVVVDSGSSDGTLDILARHPRVRVLHRPFDNHANQWNFGVHDAGITSEWVLALDADYLVSPELVRELAALEPPAAIVALITRFRYCINGEPLRGAAYPAKVTLFRRGRGRYAQDGHTQAFVLEGESQTLRGYIDHDDRKSLGRWIVSQNRYMQLEAAKLAASPAHELALMDRLRRTIVLGPLVMFLYCAFVKGNVLDGKAGLFYTFQRTLAELLLSLHLLERAIWQKQPREGLQ
jgi:glycosyltransferase involved in cell wall biosynthesis